MAVVAIGNNKGGVGKSALVALLAAAHARRQRRVLCIDMDPQANLSRRLGITHDPRHPVPTLSEAMKADDPGCAAEIVMRCRWEDPTAELIDLLPSRFDLENRISEAGTVGAVGRLSTVLGDLGDLYDHVVIDCPPSLGHLTQMALVAAGQRRPSGVAGYVLIVIEPEFDAMLGARRVAEFVQNYAARLGVPDLRVGGVIVNKVRRTDLHTTNLADIAEAFGSLVWEPTLPLWTVLADAMGAALPVHALGGDKAADLTSRLDRLAERMESS